MTNDPKALSQHPLSLAAASTRNRPDTMTQLHHAARHGWLDDIDAELDDGADIEAHTTDQYQWTPLHWASWSGQTEAVRRLLAHGANINCLEAKGSTPLMLAIHREHIETAYVLLEAGADTQFVTVGGHTAYDLAGKFDPELQAAVRRAGLNQVAGGRGKYEQEKPIF